MYKLSVSASSDPFPFAELALSSCLKDTVNVDIVYDRSEPGSILTRTADDTIIDDGETIVRILAKEAHAESNSTQVCSSCNHS